MNVNFPEGTLYDSDGNEIIVPEGHSIVYGSNGKIAFVKTDGYSAEFVYRPPNYKGSFVIDQPTGIEE